jgi:hypothetical protein
VHGEGSGSGGVVLLSNLIDEMRELVESTSHSGFPRHSAAFICPSFVSSAHVRRCWLLILPLGGGANLSMTQ